MEKETKADIEQGAAHMNIELSKGTIIVTHGSSGKVLHEVKNAKKGSWDKLWTAIREIESV